MKVLDEYNTTSPLMRFEELTSLLQLLLDSNSAIWLKRLLVPKIRRRLKLLNPDLFGLSLAAQARVVTS